MSLLCCLSCDLVGILACVLSGTLIYRPPPAIYGRLKPLNLGLRIVMQFLFRQDLHVNTFLVTCASHLWVDLPPGDWSFGSFKMLEEL